MDGPEQAWLWVLGARAGANFVFGDRRDGRQTCTAKKTRQTYCADIGTSVSASVPVAWRLNKTPELRNGKNGTRAPTKELRRPGSGVALLTAWEASSRARRRRPRSCGRGRTTRLRPRRRPSPGYRVERRMTVRHSPPPRPPCPVAIFVCTGPDGHATRHEDYGPRTARHRLPLATRAPFRFVWPLPWPRPVPTYAAAMLATCACTSSTARCLPSPQAATRAACRRVKCLDHQRCVCCLTRL